LQSFFELSSAAPWLEPPAAPLDEVVDDFSFVFTSVCFQSQGRRKP
jgi:hypothetical protein